MVDTWIIITIIAAVIILLVAAGWYFQRRIKKNKEQKLLVPEDIMRQFNAAEKMIHAKGNKMTPQQIMWELGKDRSLWEVPEAEAAPTVVTPVEPVKQVYQQPQPQPQPQPIIEQAPDSFAPEAPTANLDDIKMPVQKRIPVRKAENPFRKLFGNKINKIKSDGGINEPSKTD